MFSLAPSSAPLSTTIVRGIKLQGDTGGADATTLAIVVRGVTQRTQTAVLLVLLVRFGCLLCGLRNGHAMVGIHVILQIEIPCTFFCHLDFIALYLNERKYILKS